MTQMVRVKENVLASKQMVKASIMEKDMVKDMVKVSITVKEKDMHTVSVIMKRLQPKQHGP